MAESFVEEITKLYEAREQERAGRRQERLFLPEGDRGPQACPLSASALQPSTRTVPPQLTSPSVSPLIADGMDEDRIERALEDDYLSRDPSPSKRAAYIQRTIEKARDWAER